LPPGPYARAPKPDRESDNCEVEHVRPHECIVETLQYMRKNKLTFPADIELEYKVPKDSDPVKEITRCVEFCRQALV